MKKEEIDDNCYHENLEKQDNGFLLCIDCNAVIKIRIQERDVHRIEV